MGRAPVSPWTLGIVFFLGRQQRQSHFHPEWGSTKTSNSETLIPSSSQGKLFLPPPKRRVSTQPKALLTPSSKRDISSRLSWWLKFQHSGKQVQISVWNPVGRQLSQYFREPEIKICSCAFAFLHQGIDNSRSLAGFRGANKQTVLSPYRNGAHGSFNLVIIDRQIWILQPAAQMLLFCEGVVYRILQLDAWRILGILVTLDLRFEKFFCDGADSIAILFQQSPLRAIITTFWIYLLCQST